MLGFTITLVFTFFSTAWQVLTCSVCALCLGGGIFANHAVRQERDIEIGGVPMANGEKLEVHMTGVEAFQQIYALVGVLILVVFWVEWALIYTLRQIPCSEFWSGGITVGELPDSYRLLQVFCYLELICTALANMFALQWGQKKMIEWMKEKTGNCYGCARCATDCLINNYTWLTAILACFTGLDVTGLALRLKILIASPTLACIVSIGIAFSSDAAARDPNAEVAGVELCDNSGYSTLIIWSPVLVVLLILGCMGICCGIDKCVEPNGIIMTDEQMEDAKRRCQQEAPRRPMLPKQYNFVPQGRSNP